eukprot:SAG31_NODE_13732_length_850_cov_1.576565_1_plen_153_part_00
MATARALLGKGEAGNPMPIVADHPQASVVHPGAVQGGDIAPVRGPIDLFEKRCPTEDQPGAEHAGRDWVVNYGPVDLSDLCSKLELQPDEFFDDAAAAKENARIARPFHDRLGVGKATFIFSNTKLPLQVFQFPLYEKWQVISYFLVFVPAM